MEGIRTGIESVLADQRPCTVRQVFYQLVARGAVDKDERQYHTVARLLTEMRRSGRVPYGWITDNTRFMRKPESWSSLTHALDATRRTYRRALWDSQDCYVEVWLEKDALSGVLFDVTSEWDVPLMVTRGFPSLSFLHGAAEHIAYVRKPTFLYYFGDHDPSGVLIPQRTAARLRELAPDAEIHFQRVAVTESQIELLQLPTRPTKRDGNAHAKRFEGESVEVDAIAPNTMRAMCRACITDHIDRAALEATRRTEQAERDTLARLLRGGLPA